MMSVSYLTLDLVSKSEVCVFKKKIDLIWSIIKPYWFTKVAQIPVVKKTMLKKPPNLEMRETIPI